MPLSTCIHCKRNVTEDTEICPFCHKHPNPQNKERVDKEQAGEKISYKFKIIPKIKKEDNPEAEKDKVSASTKNLIRSLTQGPESAREKALDFILVDGRDLVEDLSQALLNPNLPGREFIAKALGRIGNRQAIPALSYALKNSDQATCLASAWALLRIGDPKSTQALKEHLRDKDSKIRIYITYVMGGIGDPEQCQDLIQMLDDSNPKVRSQAALSLTWLHGSRGLHFLKKAKKDKDPLVRAVAQQAYVWLTPEQQGNKKFIWVAMGLVMGVLSMLALYWVLMK